MSVALNEPRYLIEFVVMNNNIDHLLAVLRQENLRLRNLLKNQPRSRTNAEQATLAISDPGLVTTQSPPNTKLALYTRLFAARTDIYAKTLDPPRTGTKGWSPAAKDAYRKGVSVLRRSPLPLTAQVLKRTYVATCSCLYPLLSDATCCGWSAFDGRKQCSMLMHT